jgi:hypothetical protein
VKVTIEAITEATTETEEAAEAAAPIVQRSGPAIGLLCLFSRMFYFVYRSEPVTAVQQK